MFVAVSRGQNKGLNRFKENGGFSGLDEGQTKTPPNIVLTRDVGKRGEQKTQIINYDHAKNLF
jgi:hypothetical protein